MAEFCRYRFVGAHGKSNWQYEYIGSEDNLIEVKDRIDSNMEHSGFFRDYDLEAVEHPGDEWLEKEVARLKDRAKELESRAYRFEGMMTNRNKKPLMHIPV